MKIKDRIEALFLASNRLRPFKKSEFIILELESISQ